jgi:hypothetical protein
VSLKSLYDLAFIFVRQASPSGPCRDELRAWVIERLLNDRNNSGRRGQAFGLFFFALQFGRKVLGLLFVISLFVVFASIFHRLVISVTAIMINAPITIARANTPLVSVGSSSAASRRQNSQSPFSSRL